jgi:hypothetical protein
MEFVSHANIEHYRWCHILCAAMLKRLTTRIQGFYAFFCLWMQDVRVLVRLKRALRDSDNKMEVNWNKRVKVQDYNHHYNGQSHVDLLCFLYSSIFNKTQSRKLVEKRSMSSFKPQRYI